MCVILAAMNLMHTHFKGGGNDEEQVRLAIAELHERVLAQQAKAESCNAMLDTYSPQLNKSLAALEKLLVPLTGLVWLVYHAVFVFLVARQLDIGDQKTMGAPRATQRPLH